MAHSGYLPKFFAARSRYDTPTYGILLSASGILVVVWLNLDDVLELLNLAYALSSLLEFAAFLTLRARHPHLRRPFRVPLSFLGCVLLLTPAALVTLCFLLVPLIYHEWTKLLF